MDRDTLIAALVGALIATIPIFISNFVQIVLRINENRQREKEARIQDKKKWIEHDILEIMDSIDVVLKQMSTNIGIYKKSTWINPRKAHGYISDEDISDESNLYFEELGKSLDEFRNASAKLSKLIHSFGEELLPEYVIFNDKLSDFGKTFGGKEDTKKWDSLCRSAGKLQEKLREKLISIRDE